jgi:lactate dehydrogenase-like 2-hydroxyacid dehydrogenase
MKKPLVAVVDWKPSPRGDKNCRVEKNAIGKKATVKYFLCDKEEDWKGEVLKADYILLWHNTNMPDVIINKLEDCKAIIRMGTGYDSVEHLTAATRDIPVCNVPDYGTEEVADHSIALSLALCRQIIPTDQECKKLGWEIPNNDLFKALRKDEIAGAALDVIEDEPLKTKEEAKTPNLIVTCHSGFYSVQAAWEMRHKAAAQVRDMIMNDSWHEIENCINCHLLPRNFMRK